MEFREIVSKTSDVIGVKVYVTKKNIGTFASGEEIHYTDTVYLTKVSKIENTSLDFSNDTENFYFTNFTREVKGLPTNARGENILSNSNFSTGWFSDGHTFNYTKSSLEDSGLYKSKMKLSTSSSASQKTYKKNMFVCTGFTMNKEIVYNSYKDLTYTSITRTDLNVEDVFTQVQLTNNYSFNGKPENVTRVILTDIPASENSVQMWFYDDISGAYYFVFGVNITPEERAKGYVDVYTSILSKKDDRVFSQNNLFIGETKNFIDDLSNYGVGQVYKKK